jgi:hypothetical protein
MELNCLYCKQERFQVEKLIYLKRNSMIAAIDTLEPIKLQKTKKEIYAHTCLHCGFVMLFNDDKAKKRKKEK